MSCWVDMYMIKPYRIGRIISSSNNICLPCISSFISNIGWLGLVPSVIYIQWRFCFTRVRMWSLYKCRTRSSLFSKALSSICIIRSSVCVGLVSKDCYSSSTSSTTNSLSITNKSLVLIKTIICLSKCKKKNAAINTIMLKTLVTP